MSIYVETYVKMFVSVIALIGAINWGIVGTFEINLVEEFGKLFTDINTRTSVIQIIYILVGLCGLLLLLRRDTYLPFLGKAVFPVQKESTPQNMKERKEHILTDLPENARVIYWAALPNTEVVEDPVKAYGDYSNQGVVIANTNGEATLVFDKPASYKVPSGRTLDPHVHYRYWTEYGIASEVGTIFL